MYRRQVLAGIVTGGTAATAGCVAGLLDDLTTYTATPAEVTTETATEAGYQHKETREMTETGEVAGESVEATNYVSEYARTIDVLGLTDVEAGIFAAITTPQVTVAGEEFNPIGEMDSRDLAEMVQDQYSGFSVGETVGTRTVEPLETTAEVTTFEGEATLSGQSVDVLIDVATFEHGEDHVVTVGVYPDAVDGEAERVTTMIEGLEHDD